MARFLVVDDSPTIRMQLSSTLQTVVGSKAEIREASNADGALAAFRREDFDLVFLDMYLQENAPATGLLRQMLDAKPSARIVLTTGHERTDPEVMNAIGLGAFAYLPKPIRAESLKSVWNDFEAEVGRAGRIR